MRDPKAIAEKVVKLKKVVAGKLAQTKDVTKDPVLRKLRKDLKRNERALRFLTGKKKKLSKDGLAAAAAAAATAEASKK
jgi:hypothetical protein